jgi:hypothetical protein
MLLNDSDWEMIYISFLMLLNDSDWEKIYIPRLVLLNDSDWMQIYIHVLFLILEQGEGNLVSRCYISESVREWTRLF